MKFALLGLALTASAVTGQEYDQDNYPRYSQRGQYQQPGYDGEPNYDPRPPSGYVEPSGYGKPQPGYRQPTKKPGYGRPPVPTGDQTKRHFDQYYDNLKFCAAETSLAQCIISSQSRQDCVSDNRINICTGQFINNLCSSIASTTTGTFDNGYFKATSNTCFDAALADSLLVYNKLLREADNAFIATPQIDKWSFATIKLALSTTKTHADCVIKSFFNYLNGCARARVLRTKDLECLNSVLSTPQCNWAKEVGDGWTLRDFFDKNQESLKTVLGFHKISSKESTEDLIEKILDESAFQDVKIVNSDYDFETQKSTMTLKNAGRVKSIDPKKGTPVDLIEFHLPTSKEQKTIKAKAKNDPENTKTIFDTCDHFYKETRNAQKDVLDNEFSKLTINRRPRGRGVEIAFRINEQDKLECVANNEQCVEFDVDASKNNKGRLVCSRDKSTTEAADCKLMRDALKKIVGSDMCYSYNGYTVTFLERGLTVPVEVQQEKNKVGKLFNRYVVSWTEPHTCNAHLTQWKLSIACCKSYATVLSDLQSEWDKKNKNTKNYGNAQVSKPRPVVVEDFDTTKSVYNKILTSSSESGALKGKKAFTKDEQGALDLSHLEDALDEELEEIEAKVEDNIDVEDEENELRVLADIPVKKEETVQKSSCYLSSSTTYSRICSSIKRSWDPKTVVPVVNTKCFPQACVLSQLSKCSDIPEKKAGYDYVAQPQPGYNGYRPSSYIRSYLSLESAPTGVLAITGFVAGAAVVVVAQVILKGRDTRSTSSTSYTLV